MAFYYESENGDEYMWGMGGTPRLLNGGTTKMSDYALHFSGKNRRAAKRLGLAVKAKTEDEQRLARQIRYRAKKMGLRAVSRSPQRGCRAWWIVDHTNTVLDGACELTDWDAEAWLDRSDKAGKGSAAQ